jgi:NADP-dependent aldehyde dehydrogenase
MSEVMSIDPRTGTVREVVGVATSAAEVDELCLQASEAALDLRSRPRSWRVDLLRGMADALEAQRDALVATADAETALGKARLNGELTRTCFQLRLFAEVVEEGGFLEATIDPAAQTPMGPRPDLRRMLVPLGPVAVFGASNFPFAFSVPGGDTASALAAGCPVVVKAHESHPATSRLCGEVMAAAATACGAPTGTIALVFGREAGADLVRHPAITAVGFTGSLGGGRALMRLIEDRPTPIPFYGELSCIIPVVITEAAAIDRPDQIGTGVAASAMLGAGQFCTKPGLVLVPRGSGGDRIAQAAATAIAAEGPQTLLNAGISKSFRDRLTRDSSHPSLRELARGAEADGSGSLVTPSLFEVSLSDLDPSLTEECFGPVTLLVRYDDPGDLSLAIRSLPASLTATVHTGPEENEDQLNSLLAVLEAKAGRILFNGFPTGVAVAWAMHHGGGWPSSNSQHTSVGPTAIRRFLRPMCWQDTPGTFLPEELRDDFSGIPRRVDGVLMAVEAVPKAPEATERS